jgi:hypothetical protein
MTNGQIPMTNREAVIGHFVALWLLKTRFHRRLLKRVQMQGGGPQAE